jgi:hypothetical protein
MNTENGIVLENPFLVSTTMFELYLSWTVADTLPNPTFGVINGYWNWSFWNVTQTIQISRFEFKIVAKITFCSTDDGHTFLKFTFCPNTLFCPPTIIDFFSSNNWDKLKVNW